jgi:hypothetical protein
MITEMNYPPITLRRRKMPSLPPFSIDGTTIANGNYRKGIGIN